MGYARLIRQPLPASDEEQDRRLAICAACPFAIVKIRGACKDCGKHQTVVGGDDKALACSSCGGEVHPRKGSLTDHETPKCGACGCALAFRTKPTGSFCPKGKW